MGISNKLVSIVISSHNYGRYLGQAIESALAQTHARTEVIVVDNGSTDTSRSVIASFGERVRAALQEDRGQGGAYNEGFAMSRGDVVLFLDADDYLAPHAAATALAAFRRGVAKVQFRLAIVDRHGRALGGTLPSYAFADREIARHVAQYGFYVASPGSGNAFARSFLARVLPMPEAAFMTGADGYVGGLAPFFGEIVSLDDALASYRVHGANHSESGGVDVAKLRRLMRIDDAREAAQRAFLATRGEEPRRELALNIPGYCKQRLLSLLLEPASHPYPADTRAGLALKGAVSSWCFPHTPVWKRALSSAAFVALPVLPKRVIRHSLGWVAAAFHRGPRRPAPRGALPPSPAHGAARSIAARRLSAASASAAPRPPR